MSAECALSLLLAEDIAVRKKTIKTLHEEIDVVWPTLAEGVFLLERLYLQTDTDKKEIALLVSKLHFYLTDYDRAVSYALLAGEEFEKQPGSLYKERILLCLFDKIAKQTLSPDERTLVLARKEAERAGYAHREETAGFVLDSGLYSLLDTLAQRPGEPLEVAEFVLRVFEGHRDIRRRGKEILHTLKQMLRRNLQEGTVERPRIYLALLQISLATGGVSEAAEDILLLADEDDKFACFSLCFYLAASTSVGTRRSVIRGLERGIGKMDAEKRKDEVYGKIISIVDGSLSNKHEAEFLEKNIVPDHKYYARAKNALPPRASYSTTAALLSLGVSFFGTKNDTFLRRNIEWLSYATNWTKFNAAATIGQIHARNTEGVRETLAEYLPKGDGTLSVNQYTEGGALYALGLVHARAPSQKTADYLLEILQTTASPILKHGCALGLGAAASGSGDWGAIDVLKAVLYGDEPVAGQAAGVAIGLLLAGAEEESGKTMALAEELVTFASETEHEKISTGIHLGVAVLLAGREGDADGLCARLVESKSGVERAGGVLAMAAAYACRYSAEVVQKLTLLVATDEDDTVRRNAATTLGFVLAGRKGFLREAVDSMAQNFNPHVRYGATLAAGIGFGRTGDEAVCSTLIKLLADPVDIVRQGAFVALGLILAQHTGSTCKHVEFFRAKVAEALSEKTTTENTVFGAILANGFLNCAGQNGVVSLFSHSQQPDTQSIAGLLLFTQYWEWFPLFHFVSLAVQTRCFVVLDDSLAPMKKTWKVCAPASSFAYFRESQKKEEKARATVAVLSTTRTKNEQKKEEPQEHVADTAMEEDSFEKENLSRITLAEESALEDTRLNIFGTSCGVFLLAGKEPSPQAKSFRMKPEPSE
ncbi:MAG: 26S proteasome regulatory subunit N2, RPN2/PSMD1 [Amphiamblys sp. WSBS2006]|nr:MAG: 26S proteasome regulatory subunit N2, RPN2/PSMD1 [Amphiamblys sp. WSBS2006]